MRGNGGFGQRPQRLAEVFQVRSTPLWFVTMCTAGRKSLLADDIVHDAWIRHAKVNAEAGRCMGRYVLMPDHAHFFVRLATGNRLSDYVKFFKEAVTKALRTNSKVGQDLVWQPGFFDHLMRGAESYEEKWEYVSANPVRAGLAVDPAGWPWQGEIVPLSYN